MLQLVAFDTGGVPGIESAADVFSFGVLLWEVATGSIPWEGLNWAYVTRAVAGGRRLEFPDAVVDEAPENADPNSPGGDAHPHRHLPEGITNKDVRAMAEIAAACWEAEPGARPPIEEVLASLKSLMLKSSSQTKR